MIQLDSANEIKIMQNDHIGLFDGIGGESILLFLLSKCDSESINKQRAQQSLDIISDNIDSMERLNFSDGLAGIGWMVEWIVQNGFLEFNTNEVLEDIDNTLYKSVIYSSDNNISLARGTIGKILFFWSRYRSKNPSTHRLKNIFQEECLVLLTDDLYEHLCGENAIFHKKKLSSDDVINLGHVIYFLSNFLWTKINEPTIENTLYGAMNFIMEIIDKNIGDEDFNSIEVTEIDDYLFLSSCFYLAGKNHQLNFWQQKGIKYASYFKDMLKQKDVNYLSGNIILSSMILDNQIATLENVNYSNSTLTNIKGKFFIYHLATQNIIDFDTAVSLLILR
ncbi:lanthionine synthetase LanC family protein [Rhizosphaericola mali]|uniref:Lanthionine synthetase C family protein n=1 Tax=Rhizosphaericola mali TaxID=2545455 RepID=A0A5P2G4I5_9BACT|nr:lanthionine synthetase LanC family protein [Rhizosphaericola mali]QES88732.1 hypothetical protein E0W69_008735 [Rhizosphaericola mali]